MEKVETAGKVEGVEKKPKTKRTTRKSNIAQEVFIQYAEKEVAVNDILEKVKNDYIEKGNKETSIKSIQLYIKPEENAAYCVINGESNNEKINI